MNRRNEDRRAEVAARLLQALYAGDEAPGQRAAVLDAITAARRADPARRGYAGAWVSRDALLALASTLAAALVLVAVIVGVRHETAQTPAGGPDGLTAEELRLIHAAHRRPEGATVRLAPPAAVPVPDGPTAVAPAVHPAIAALQRGCDQGSALSCRRLGTAFQRGRGVLANRQRAFEFYDRGCRAGDARACALRDAADRTLNDVDRDDRDDAAYFSTLGL
ncbi:MAG: hypothetical protein JWM10_3285 [Myxococcaceae bacterium]|nr:hypothetical protein [Myxococcaceae bacterium]